VFWLRVEALAGNFHTLSFEATALAVFTLLTLIICRGVSSRIPGPIVALLLSTCAVYFFSQWRRLGRGLEEFRVDCRTGRFRTYVRT
jgi:MFS superfamily sulfate permease-like transporter